MRQQPKGVSFFIYFESTNAQCALDKITCYDIILTALVLPFFQSGKKLLKVDSFQKSLASEQGGRKQNGTRFTRDAHFTQTDYV